MHSVLFAARSNELVQEYEFKLRSLQALFAELFLDRPFSNEHNDVFLDYPYPTVIDTISDGVPFLSARMPEFGHAMSLQKGP